MKNTATRLVARKQRQSRVRKKISGTGERPRLAVFRSAKHIYAQVINDETSTTIVAAGTTEKAIKEAIEGYTGNKAAASVVGKTIAERLLEKSISSVVFDRGGFLYHGRIRALAEAARESGIKF